MNRSGVYLLLFLIFLLLFLIVRYLLVTLFLDEQLDGVPDELAVFLHHLLNLPLLQVLRLVLLYVQHHFRSSSQRLAAIWPHREAASGCGLPDILLIVVVLAVHDHLVGDQVGGVEAHTKLTDHRDVRTGLQCLHEGFCSGLCDRAEVVDHVSLGHADTSIDDCDRAVGFVWNDLNEEVLARVETRWIGQALVADLVESIGRVGDQLTEEDFLVRVEGVDDEAHQLGDLGLEGEGLDLGRFGCCINLHSVSEQTTREHLIKTTE